MTTTDTAPPAAPRPRVLRRSRTGRVGAGVAAGLGDYFGLDPVLFRVLFAVSAFFGGAGVLAYLVAWAAIPEEGAPAAPLDSLVAAVRRRNIPPWGVVAALAVVLWLATISWWAPAPFVPALVVLVLVLVAVSRRTAGPVAPPPVEPPSAQLPAPAAAPTAADAPTVDLTKPAAAPRDPLAAWFGAARAAARERRRRAFPVRVATLVAIVVALGVLAVVDAAHGVALPLYFAFAGSLALLGLLVGVVLRRTPWSLSGMVVVSLAGLLAFGATSARLHDGIGQTTWAPTSTPASSYRLAIGSATLDLTHVDSPVRARTVYVTMAAGQTRVLLPRDAAVTVRAHVRIGTIEVDGTTYSSRGGFHMTRTVPAGTPGPRLTVVVRLADGAVVVDHR